MTGDATARATAPRKSGSTPSGRASHTGAHIALVALLVGVLAIPATLLATGTAPSLDQESRVGDEGWDAAASGDWPADAVLYHVFVDRFADGDAPETQVAGHPDDPDYAGALTDWMGGDLAGIEARLDHIVATGANTLWVSPVNTGPAFHGYHPTDLLDVDPRFGDVDRLHRLVDAAQARGVKVVYDLVLNHTSNLHPWFVEAQERCEGSPFVDWYRFSDCPDDYAAFAGLPELPQLDLDHAPAREYVFDEVLPFYLDDVGVDGFRLDHVEGPSRDFWRAFDAELAERWPDTLVIGEVWAQPATIDSYGDVLDAATAFPFRDRLLATFARGGDARAVAMPVAGWLDAEGLPDPSLPRRQTYVSSHDQPRFAHEAGGDLDRLAAAYAAILTAPGLPTVYYGDEVGMAQTDALPPGADFADRWFREPMPWDRDVWPVWDEATFDRVSAFARARTVEPALHSGRYLEVVGEGAVWVFERLHREHRLLVAINTSEVAADLTEALTDAGWGDVGLLEDAEVVVRLGGVASDDSGDEGAGEGAADEGSGADDAASAVQQLPGLDAVVLRLPAAPVD